MFDLTKASFFKKNILYVNDVKMFTLPKGKIDQ